MITLQDLRNATGGQLFGEAAAEQFAEFCHDPRFAAPNQLFVALRTAAGDGHRFIEDAIDAGVSGVLCQHPPTCNVTGITVVLVGDTGAALAQWASYVLRQYGTTIIGVAGAIGKSSTLSAISAVLSTKYTVYYNAEALPGRDGLALGLGGLGPEHQAVVIELAPLHSGELADMLAVAPPHVGVVTRLNAGATSTAETAFTENSVQQLAAALPENGALVLNAADARLRDMIPSLLRGSITFTQDMADKTPAADFTAVNVQYFVDKVGFDVMHQSQQIRGCWTPALGEPGLTAALAALAVAYIFEVPLPEALRALKDVRPLPGRLMMLDALSGAAMLDNTYNATPASMLASLDLLSAIEVGTGRRILALGDLDSPAHGSSAAHRMIGERAAQVADWLLVLGERAIEAGRFARQTGLVADRVDVFYRHEDLAVTLRESLKPDDVLLVAGSRQSHMERICGLLLANRDDRSWLVQRQTQTGEVTAARTTATSWIELDLAALAFNLREICRRVGSKCSIIAVVQSNAYGHGLLPVAVTALHNGASMLAVQSLEEGIELREAGVKQPVLLLGSVSSAGIEEVVRRELIMTVYDRESARILARAAGRLKRTALVHIRVDTGTGDLGLLPQNVVPLVRDLIHMDGLKIDGLYTDFAAADTLLEVAATQEQLERFKTVYNSIRATGLAIPHIHAANSAAIFTLPASYFTAVRPGIALYGLHPSIDVSVPTSFRRVLSWKTRVVQVRTLPGNWYAVSSATPRAEMKVAVIPVGYADGFRAAPRNWGEVLINGQRAAILGHVSMDHTVVYVSHLPEVEVGDEVVLIGRQGAEEITAEDVARRLDTSNYEVVAGIAPSVPRLVHEES